MKNQFAKVMSERTDEDLIKIVTSERESYEPNAIEAADAEIEKRNIDISEFEKIREESTSEKEQKVKVNSNVVGSGIRFLNFLIDSIIASVLSFIISFIIGFFVQTSDQETISIIGFLILVVTYIAYYSIMEIKFQKTIGKFITKTKVVKLNGQKPSNSDIISRSFYRFLPFDRISFLFVKNGIHDFLSKTKVVKDRAE